MIACQALHGRKGCGGWRLPNTCYEPIQAFKLAWNVRLNDGG